MSKIARFNMPKGDKIKLGKPLFEIIDLPDGGRIVKHNGSSFCQITIGPLQWSGTVKDSSTSRLIANSEASTIELWIDGELKVSEYVRIE